MTHAHRLIACASRQHTYGQTQTHVHTHALRAAISHCSSLALPSSLRNKGC